jgi:dihydrofolate reductase
MSFVDTPSSAPTPASALPPKPVGLRVLAIAAMAENRVIGAGNALPWSLPEDLRWFRDCTRGKILLMGRKTYASIGRPLPKRRTLVLTRDPHAAPIEGVELVPDLAAAMHLASEAPAAEGGGELWICGGAEIYALTLPLWDELLLTRVKQTIAGDAFFPPFEHALAPQEVLRDTPELRIERHVRK